ncbi:SAUR-like auxin-responsive protein family [Artemisia annua]|uniref:SAUR-like auxin-responsive protein family n=1 Tax=Artemisia annua TaxID=35608 RepID=A0A2U1LDD1_ARTAN|nr:SAUR-like auxin-responsive protein family [Artemisia annua]
MLGMKIGSFKNLAKMAKIRSRNESSQSERLLSDGEEEEKSLSYSCSSPSSKTPTGSFTLYIGEERRRFVVPMGYLSHPLFKMLLEKSSEEFGFGQKNGLVVPCSVNAFQEMLNTQRVLWSTASRVLRNYAVKRARVRVALAWVTCREVSHEGHKSKAVSHQGHEPSGQSGQYCVSVGGMLQNNPCITQIIN